MGDLSKYQKAKLPANGHAEQLELDQLMT